MSNIKISPIRTLTYVVGHDADGKGGRHPVISYAYKADGEMSLAHIAQGFSVGDTFDVQFFDHNRQAGSAGQWKIVEVRGSPISSGIGDIAANTANIVMEGENYRFAFVPSQRNTVDIRAVGIGCNDPTIVVNHTRLSRIIAAARVQGYFLTGAGELSISETLDLQLISCDFSKLLIRPWMNGLTRDQYSATGTPAGFMPFYGGGPGGSQAGITTFDFTDWGGTTRRYGAMIVAGGNTTNAYNQFQKFYAHGDGNFDFTREATCFGVVFRNLDGPLAHAEVDTAYAFAVGIGGSTEKHVIDIRSVYCTHAAVGLPGSSADTVILNINGQNCQHWWTEADGSDTSYHVNLLVESNNNPGDGSPAIYIRNGKYTYLGGQMRSGNGRRMLVVDKTSSIGVDTLELGLTCIHGYGGFEIRRVRNLLGFLHVKNWNDDNSPVPETHPCVTLGQIGNAGNFRGSIVACENVMGLQVGTVGGRYSWDTDLGFWEIVMGNIGAPFNSDGTENPSGFPTTLDAFNVARMKGGSIRFTQVKGRGTIGAQVTENARIILPRSFVSRYTLSKDPAAVCEAGYVGLVVA